jgi:hypothetical protein
MTRDREESIDAMYAREFGGSSWSVTDAASHRPGFRTAASLNIGDRDRPGPSMAESGLAAFARGEIKGPPDRDDEDRDGDDEDEREEGEEDEDEDEDERDSKKGRRDARSKHDSEEEEDYDAAPLACSYCGGNGVSAGAACPACDGTGVAPASEPDSEINNVVEATQNFVERRNRFDVPDGVKKLQADHRRTMDKLYQQGDRALENAWRERE